MYPKFDILGCKGMTKTFHFIGEQTNMVHTLKTRLWHVPLTNSRDLERQKGAETFPGMLEAWWLTRAAEPPARAVTIGAAVELSSATS